MANNRVNMKIYLSLAAAAALLLASASATAQNDAGATETTPSRSEYFSWINNTNEGATEAQTLANLAFFRYMKETYGMQLDIYAFDAGAIDGSKRYGSMKSADFKKQFPRGFGPLSEFASHDGTRLGLWCGPDGFGDTPEEAAERSEMMVSLVRDYNFGLFKMDAVCGQLRPSKYDYFNAMMGQIRKLSPDFVLLNHRLNLGEGTKYSTTYLYGGAETYIDILMTNTMTAPHHRGQAISRGIPPTRLTEDHGVCLSTCLDFWEDDLVLQAFNRSLILAPELYGSPWFLSDEELPKLAFIFNLHRDYRDILVNGKELPVDKYGPYAMSRGDGKTQFITLRNISWQPVRYHVELGEETGLDKASKVQVRQYHPYCLDMGSYKYGSSIDIEVLPFRSCLVKVTTVPETDPVLVSGVPYEIINDRVGSTRTVKLLGNPGETYKYKVRSGRTVKSGTVTFAGETLKKSPYRHIAAMQKCGAPEDQRELYYATAFAANNNALEVDCLERSGETSIPEVKAARDAFFGQRTFVERGIWDRNLFDDDPNTFFNIAFRWGEMRIGNWSMFMLDFGEPTDLDKLVIETDTEYSLSPKRIKEGTKVYVSDNLKDWKEITMVNELESVVDLSGVGPVRWLRFNDCPIRIAEVRGFKDGKAVSRDKWRANNLFPEWNDGFEPAKAAWSASFTLDEIPANSYLSVACNGRHGRDGVWAAFKVDGEYVGCPDRAPSYAANTWECPVNRRDGNYTYYLPLTEDMKGKKIEVWLLGPRNLYSGEPVDAQIYMGVYPLAFESKEITF